MTDQQNQQSYDGGTPEGTGTPSDTFDTAASDAPPEPEQVDEEQESSGARFSGQGEVPDLDPETAAGVSPLPAVSVNPGLQYDDDLAGKPEDAEQ